MYFVFDFCISCFRCLCVLQLSVTESKSTVGMNKYKLMHYVLSQKSPLSFVIHLLKGTIYNLFCSKELWDLNLQLRDKKWQLSFFSWWKKNWIVRKTIQKKKRFFLRTVRKISLSCEIKSQLPFLLYSMTGNHWNYWISPIHFHFFPHRISL